MEVRFGYIERNLKITDAELLVKGLISALTQVESINNESVKVTAATIKNIATKTEIKRAVEYAVEHNTAELFLQPIVNATTHELVGAEALARIRNKDNELIPPGLFIPVAERNGRINSLGKQMFEKSCAFIKNHDIDSMGISWLNVNLSPVQFLSSSLNESFSTILQLHEISAEKLHLELTEEAMIDYTLLQHHIQDMKETGFSFVLDDYGSGYSNVSRLKSGPFVNVKLDMSIVWDYFKTKDEILPTLVQAFKRMKFSVTAEGIESEEMANAMRDIGCDYLQGFYFSKPLPADEFAAKYGKQKS
ncbi:EAL domain-containing protein [Treponema zioleckii]|uniref:EAL domain-containing protein n=1 Tax=Treponema zioleckii TaxID=331680 RepID=UPI00168B94B9|nr:EAL domain-containing protein [Treponema zioleckii]